MTRNSSEELCTTSQHGKNLFNFSQMKVQKDYFFCFEAAGWRRVPGASSGHHTGSTQRGVWEVKWRLLYHSDFGNIRRERKQRINSKHMFAGWKLKGAPSLWELSEAKLKLIFYQNWFNFFKIWDMKLLQEAFLLQITGAQDFRDHEELIISLVSRIIKFLEWGERCFSAFCYLLICWHQASKEVLEEPQRTWNLEDSGTQKG